MFLVAETRPSSPLQLAPIHPYSPSEPRNAADLLGCCRTVPPLVRVSVGELLILIRDAVAGNVWEGDRDRIRESYPLFPPSRSTSLFQ